MRSFCRVTNKICFGINNKHSREHLSSPPNPGHNFSLHVKFKDVDIIHFVVFHFTH